MIRIKIGLSVLLFIICLDVNLVEGQVDKIYDLPRIGVSAPLTMSWGIDVKNAMLFANKHFADNKYHIIFEDDKCLGKEAVTIAHKYIDIDHVEFAVGSCSATVLSAAPVYAAANVVQMSSVASSSKIGKTKQVIYRTIPSDQDSARELYHYVTKLHQTLGVLTETADYSNDFYEDLTTYNQNSKIKIINEFYLPEERNFSSLLLKLKKAKVDSLLINANSERSFVTILKQIKSLKIQVPIYGALIPGSRTFVSLAGDDANGIIFVDFPRNDLSLNSEGRKYFEMFVEEYGNPQSWDIVVATTIELFKVIDETVKSQKPPREFLTATRFFGMFGPYGFLKNGDISGLKPALLIIKNDTAYPLPSE